ncbi:MAG: nucleotidyltransferase family protein [Thermoplasmatales archaeon]
MEVKGAILTGGYGKRMQGFDPETPKNLLPLRGNYTILHRQLRDFKLGGVNEVYMLTGYMSSKIEERFGEEWMGIRIRYLREERPMGTLWSIRNLFSIDTSNFIIKNGDTICDLNLKDLIDISEKSRRSGFVTAVKMRSPYGIIKISGNKVTTIEEKPIMNNYINAGTYLFKRKAINYIVRMYDGKDIEMTVLKAMAAAGDLGVLKYDGFWLSVDSLKDYETIRGIYEKRVDHEFGFSILMDNSIEAHFIRSAELTPSGRYEIEVERGLVSINGIKHVSGAKLRVNNGDKMHIEKGTVLIASKDLLRDMVSFL